jgi:DNA-binding CsgD family transcriptional regulator
LVAFSAIGFSFILALYSQTLRFGSLYGLLMVGEASIYGYIIAFINVLLVLLIFAFITLQSRLRFLAAAAGTVILIALIFFLLPNMVKNRILLILVISIFFILTILSTWVNIFYGHDVTSLEDSETHHMQHKHMMRSFVLTMFFCFIGSVLQLTYEFIRVIDENNIGAIIFIAVDFLLVLVFAVLLCFDFIAAFGRRSAVPISDQGNAYNERCHQITKYCNLSQREGEVLFFLARGHDAAFIEETLHISNATVKTHCRHIYKKVGVRNKHELINYFHQNTG